MGLIGTTFQVVSKINDKVPFTPQTKTILDTASKFDVLQILPVLDTELESGDVESELEHISKSLVGSNEAITAVNDNSAKVNMIKEKLILSRRIQIAINEQDDKFNVENIVRHDNGIIKDQYLAPPFSPQQNAIMDSNGSTLIDSDSDENEEIEATGDLQEGVGYLNRALFNERISEDDILFDRFFSNSMAQIWNTISRTKPTFNFKRILKSFDQRLKFIILETYLADNQLVKEFKTYYYNKHKTAFKMDTPRPSPIKRVTSEKTIFTSPSNTQNAQNSQMRRKTRIKDYHNNDQLTLKTIQLIIALSFKFVKFFFNIIFPLIQLILLGFLDLNDQYQVINKCYDMAISIFSLFIDQMLLYIDNGESFDASRGTPLKNRGIIATSKRNFIKALPLLFSEWVSRPGDKQDLDFTTSTPEW